MRYALAFLLLGCGTPPAPIAQPTTTASVQTPPPKKKTTVLEAAALSGKLKIFLESVPKSEIHGDHVTLIAPTDEAFLTISPERRPEVARHHVILDPIEGDKASALDQRSIEVRTENGETYVDGIRVIARIGADDGVVWVIDRTLDKKPNLQEAIVRLGANSFAALAMQVAISGNGPFTIFAPTDAALEKIDLKKDSAKSIVMRHVARGIVPSADLSKLTMIRAVGGAEIKVEDGAIGGAHIVRGPYLAENGIVYLVDALIAR